METLDPRERESILRDLRSSDEEVRRLAVERVGLLPPREARGLLVDRLGDVSWRVRKAAVERLGQAPGSESALIESLADGDNPGRRNAALEALIRRGADAVPSLIEATSSADLDVRKQVIDALAGIADIGSAWRLREMLAERDANIRGAAADALGAVGEPQAIPQLLAAAHEDGEALVRLSALRALLRMEVGLPARDLAPMLNDPQLRAAALELLGFSEDEAAVELVLKGLQASSRTAWEAAIGSLLRLLAGASSPAADGLVERIQEAVEAAPGLLPAVFDRLADAALPARLILVQFLGLLPRRDVVLPLLEASGDEALEEVVVGALQGLGEPCESALVETFERLDALQRRIACRVLAAGHEGASEARLLAALSSRDFELRSAAAVALAARGCAAASEPLLRALQAVAGDDDAAIREREALAEALCSLAGDSVPEPQLIELLLQDLSGGCEAHRCCTARILGRIGLADEDGIRRLLSDPSESVRRAAVEGLGSHADVPFTESLHLALADESPAVRSAAVRVVARDPDPRAMDGLRALAGDGEARVRAAAQHALGLRLAGAAGCAEASDCRAQAGELLAKGLADLAPVAIAAANALSALGGEEAVEIAREQLGRSEPEVLEAAVACIGSHGQAEALEELLPLLSHSAWSVRAQVAQSLAARACAPAVPAILRRLELEDDDFVREAILRALRALEG